MTRLALVAVFAGVLLSACGGGSALRSGKVVDKYVIAPHDESQTTYVKAGSVLIPITETHHVGPTYWVTIEGRPSADSKLVDENVRVDVDTYSRTKMGQMYSEGGETK